jgi:autotransporter-associated beta strand protein
VVSGGALFKANAGFFPESHTVTQPVIINGTLGIEGDGTTILGPSAPVTGPGHLEMRSAGGLTIQSAASHSGETRIASTLQPPPPFPELRSTLRLSGASGALTDTSGITVKNATLLIDGSELYVGGAEGRVRDGAPVSLASGGLQLTGHEFLPTAENIGSISATGHSQITIAPIGPTTLTAAALVRQNNATLLFRGPGLGSAPAAGAGRILFATSLVIDLIGGGGSGSQTSILPYAIGESTTTGYGSGLVTYDLQHGVRLLDPQTEYASTLAAATSGTNVRLTSPATVDGTASINALVVASGGSVAGSGQLAIESGTILSQGHTTIGADLNFGTREANVFAVEAASLAVSGRITGSAGLTKSGPGNLTLSAPNSFSGPLTINEGGVTFSNIEALGGGVSPIKFTSSSNTASLAYTGLTPLDFTRNVEVVEGLARFVTSREMTISGVVSGAGGLMNEGSRQLTLATANTYTGSTVVKGSLAIIGDAALGSGGSVELSSGGISLLGSWMTDRRIVVSTRGSIGLNGHSALFSGPIEGSGTLNLSDGPVSLTGESPFVGGVSQVRGSIRLASGGSIRASSIFTDGALVLDNSGGIVTDRLADAASVTASSFSLLGNSSADVRETVGALSIRGRLEVKSPGPFGTVLTADAFVPSQNVITRIEGDNLGGAVGAGYSRIVVNATQAFKGGLLPRALIVDSSSNTISSFALYDSALDSGGTIGVRALRDGDYATGTIRNPANGGTTPIDANVLLSTSTDTIGSLNEVNTLTLAGSAGLSLAAGQTLKLGSGGILARSGGSGLIEGGKIEAGPGLLVASAGDLTVRSLVQTDTVEKFGAGTLTLGSNSFGNQLRIDEGTVRLERGSNPSKFTNLQIAEGATLDLNDARLELQSQFLEIRGAIQGVPSSSITKTDNGHVVVNDLSRAAGELTVSYGNLELNGQLAPGAPAFVWPGATLSGNADIRRVLSLQGTLRPGGGLFSTNVGRVNTGELRLFGESTLALDIGSAGHDQVNVTGGVRLYGRVNLTLSLGYQPAPGASFLIINNDGVDPIDRDTFGGSFSFGGRPLLEGSRFTVSETELAISYFGGDGNDVVLYAIPEPSSVGLLLAGLGMLMRRKRRS